MKYYCHHCGNKFDNVMVRNKLTDVIQSMDTLGFGIKRTEVCPQCGSEDFQEILRSDNK